jgi:hypothetical protein
MTDIDDKLIWEISLNNVDKISWTSIARSHKLTEERAKQIFRAAMSLHICRTNGVDRWKLCSEAPPPCLINVLFDDGDNVYAGYITEICPPNERMNFVSSYTRKRVGDPIWWRELPEGAREYYGFNA